MRDDVVQTYFLPFLQTWFFTDSLDANLMARTDGHLIATNCTESHSRVSLACKMSAEFDTFLQSHKL